MTDGRPAARLAIEYFTDPLCAWSWAFEPTRRRLREALGDAVAWRLRTGGMVARWDGYDDPVHSVSRPAQMAPLWYEVGLVTGARVDEQIWRSDPPASSYPACLAVKAAEQQSAAAGERLLVLLWEAVMLHRRNIARWEVVDAVAASLAEEHPGAFDLAQFHRDLDGPAADAFRADLAQARCFQICRFPSLVVFTPERPPALLVGYRPFDVLKDELTQLAPWTASRWEEPGAHPVGAPAPRPPGAFAPDPAAVTSSRTTRRG